jgi:CRISPR/Cas system-associated exonuclease Cas4 (RecB family)
MPLAGFTCDATELPVDVPACLACARAGALPGCHQTAPVIAGIVRGLRPDDLPIPNAPPERWWAAGRGLTVTTLIGCLRKARLMQREPYWLKPSESYWAYRGALMHGIAARYAEETDQVLAEQRLSIVVETLNSTSVEVSGQPDLVLLDQRHLIDYKTTKAVPTGWRAYVCPETEQVISEGPYALRRKFVECPHCILGQHDVKAIEVLSAPRAKVQHALQVSLYRLLLHRHGHVIETAEIVYMDMDTQLRVSVDLLSLDEAERYLRERVTLAVQPDLPPVLTASDEVWECQYCAVSAACAARAAEAAI